ncbi:DUF1223 domain-containing protein [Sulfitobacter sp. F26169L]|uniref:DUF1223 domain-containing protein n=1 Tax=Sulfitobacter sp. F26169L TaxID=2996015 RepID=UPI002260A8EB|nr:DUF1223 domain-containing protein [Sulfitobacter sp. F26169L]MCX7565053.1 DUF1223 domain-containing protein [Sulfitobacter sp. F26169L]
MSRASTILTVAALGFGLCAAPPAAAEQVPVVVELYTSQGCSSCPPADAIFSKLSERDDVIAIALHVDYWDYIGWKDEFGHPAYAERQRKYASKGGRRSVYTPEMVINGQTDIVGSDAMELFKAIAHYKETPPPMSLDITREGGNLHMQGSVPAGGAVPMEIHVLRVKPSHTSKITRGENSGKTIQYSNIAHDWRVAGSWNGQAPLDLSFEVTGDDPVVVLVQETGAGPIVAAARVD